MGRGLARANGAPPAGSSPARSSPLGRRGLVDAGFAALQRAQASPSGVLKPLDPIASGDPKAAAWPGEGQYLFAVGGVPDANYITGPTYLLNWVIKTVDKVDHRRLRAEAIAFTEMILRLGRTPADQLGTYTLFDESEGSAGDRQAESTPEFLSLCLSSPIARARARP